MERDSGHVLDRENFVTQKVNIDGCAKEEELNWWDPFVRQTHSRPGPGILPTLLENYLHNAGHSLCSVSVSPELEPTDQSSESHLSTSPPPVDPPSADEVRKAIPHPNAYYCPEHNSWVLSLWESSTTNPPLSKSYDGYPLPDVTRRRKTHSCVDENPQSVAQANKTHHFHYYEAAVDASKIMTPFKRADWECHSRTKPQRRQAIPMDSHESEEELLDLYICCQCSLYCVVSDVISGVIPQRTFEAFMKERLDHPLVGKTLPVSLAIALETVLMWVRLTLSQIELLKYCPKGHRRSTMERGDQGSTGLRK